MRVLVAMSGGVDSSVAAALLAEAGHDVVGCTLRLWGGHSDTGCCSVADVDDARRVAQALSIDHHVFNLADDFEARVVSPYVSAHQRGETPNPCVECNRWIKFDALAARAARLGFDALATGHHARVTQGAAGPELRRGADRAKDQSYVLGFLDAAVLRRVVLPVGALTKAEVRERASALGLRTAAKPDSQDVCFIPRRGRRAFLAERLAPSAAVVVDASSGERLGTVDAAELVTIGQRRGIGCGADGEPRYVTRVDLASRTITVARRDDALVDVLDLAPRSVVWAREPRADGSAVLVQTSAHGEVAAASLGGAPPHRLDLAGRVRPVAPGQLVVLYEATDPDLVVGAATVAAPIRAVA